VGRLDLAAPAAVDETLFLAPDGRPLPQREAQRSGRAVGAPSAVAMWAAAHAQGGRLPWARLLAPAIALADAGAPIGPRLHRQLSDTPTLREDARAAHQMQSLGKAQQGRAQKAMAEANVLATFRPTRLDASARIGLGAIVEIGSAPTHVLLIDGAGSRGVLASQTGAFGEYVNSIREIKTLMDQTVEIQGRLTTSLGEIARLQEVFAL
jgi:hypothetical protein